MNLNEAETLILEDRLTDLELKILAREADSALAKVWPKSKPTARATDADKWSLRVTRDAKGSSNYELRNDSGAALPLPADRATWPKAVREAAEKFEAADKQRTRDGRLISSAVGTVGIK